MNSWKDVQFYAHNVFVLKVDDKKLPIQFHIRFGSKYLVDLLYFNCNKLVNMVVEQLIVVTRLKSWAYSCYVKIF